MIPTINANVLSSSIDLFPIDFIDKTFSGVFSGVAELSFDGAPKPIPLIAETL